MPCRIALHAVSSRSSGSATALPASVIMNWDMAVKTAWEGLHRSRALWRLWRKVYGELETRTVGWYSSQPSPMPHHGSSLMMLQRISWMQSNQRVSSCDLYDISGCKVVVEMEGCWGRIHQVTPAECSPAISESPGPRAGYPPDDRILQSPECGRHGPICS
jgi:hypothetical protein